MYSKLLYDFAIVMHASKTLILSLGVIPFSFKYHIYS